MAQTPALLQYRNKAAGPGLRRQQALALAEACARAGVPLVVNDDWRLALEVGAPGAHLGEDDGDLRLARREAPGLWLGASCYDQLERARQAVAAGADYVAFGAFFPSGTKPGARRASPRPTACATASSRSISSANSAGVRAWSVNGEANVGNRLSGALRFSPNVVRSVPSAKEFKSW